jgi:hypothetical protein
MTTTIITKGELHGSPPPTTMNPRASFSTPTNALAQKSLKPTMNVAPRIDVEPIYTQLKGLISDYWQLYKQTVADFVIGMTNLIDTRDAQTLILFQENVIKQKWLG